MVQTLELCLASENLIEVGSTLLQDVDHARTIEDACVETYRVGGKRPHHPYNNDSISNGGRYHLSKDRHHSRPIRPMVVVP